MRKSTKMVKRAACLFLVVLMSIESFAAVVSDNDGAAFVTKKEFEDLKATFDKQVDDYNNSLDRKIDGAISNYLEGIKVQVWEPTKLDPKSQYIFPLVMCGPSNEWNNLNYAATSTSKGYLDFQITFFNSWTHSTKYGRNGGGDNTGGYEQLNKSYTDMPAALPAYSHDDNNKIVRVSKVLETFDYPGRVGTMNTLASTTETRSINGTNRKVFRLQQRGRGQLRAYIRSNDSSQYYDGNGEYTPSSAYLDGKVFNYPVFIGLSVNDFNWNFSSGISWKGTTPTVYPWTRDGVKSGRGMNANVKNIMSTTGYTNMQQVLNYINSSSFKSDISDHKKGLSQHGDQSASGGSVHYANPYLVLPEWVHTNGTNTCYYGTANMQAHIAANGGYWNLTPQQGTSAATQKVSLIIPQDQSQNNAKAFNFGNKTYPYFSPFIPNDYRIFPEWVVTNNTTWVQESSNNFGQLRASVVSYIDSNDKIHYCDEGMYLGTMEKGEATVKFKLKFKDDSNWGVDLAISKKPFGFDAVTSNQIAYKYTINNTATEYNVAAGGQARVNCNDVIKVEVEDLEKGDMLFLKWTPVTAGHYVELESFSDYFIKGT